VGNKEARDAVTLIISNYDKLMSKYLAFNILGPITLAEKHYNFSEEQLTAARQAKILSPHTDYQDILHTIQTKKGISFEDRPEHLLGKILGFNLF